MNLLNKKKRLWNNQKAYNRGDNKPLKSSPIFPLIYFEKTFLFNNKNHQSFMNENHKKRGLTHSRLLTAVAISSLLLSSGNVMATQANPDNSFSITEQLQTINVTGLVVDAAGEPVIGASVVEKGTTNGNITNVDGKFTLTVKTGAILQISYVGYQTQEIKATKMMKIVLKEDSELLSEVVVVGYGAQKRENLTGSVASVDVNKTLEGRQIPDVGRGLQGTTPGLSVVIPSGEIGSDPTMKIRGQIGSIDGASTPLILLDNVEIPSIQMVNPDDIDPFSTEGCSFRFYLWCKGGIWSCIDNLQKRCKVRKSRRKLLWQFLMAKHIKKNGNGRR